MKKLLVVEDDPSMAKLLVYRFEREGYEVFPIGDGAQAMNAVAEVRPDLIVMGVCLPNVDGLELTRQLRANPEYAELPVLMLSAMARAVDIRAGMAAGATAYMTKPFSMPRLVAKVGELVARSRAA